MEPGHRCEIQSINIQLEDLDKRIAKATKDMKKRSHLVNWKKLFMTRKLEIEMLYQNAKNNPPIVIEDKPRVPLRESVVRFLGFR